MDWIKTHYERIILAAAALLLFLGAISILRHALTFSSAIWAKQNAVPRKAAGPPGQARELMRAADELSKPEQWAFRGRSGLFVPEKHFIGPDGVPVTLKTSEVHPPVPNAWLETYGLPIADADVLTQDPDDDGFNNLEEWQGHSNPIEKSSHPAYLTDLKVKAIREEPFQLLFSAWVKGADGITFQINTIDFAQPTQFLKLDDVVAGTRFKIEKFAPKYAKDRYGTTVDVSELTLQHIETGEELTLTKEKVAMSPESVVTLVYSWPASQVPQEFQVRKDQEFSLKPEDQVKYKLVDAQPNKAVIVDIQNPEERIEIGFGP
jgi:hypothetical protein